MRRRLLLAAWWRAAWADSDQPTAVLTSFNFSVAEGGGITIAVGNWTEDGRPVPPPSDATFTLQSQFSEPGPERWTTLQPPWGGVPSNVVVDRSDEARGRTVVHTTGAYRGLWTLERVYQVSGHRVLVNDTLTVSPAASAATGNASALAIYVQHIMAADAVGHSAQYCLRHSFPRTN